MAPKGETLAISTVTDGGCLTDLDGFNTSLGLPGAWLGSTNIGVSGVFPGATNIGVLGVCGPGVFPGFNFQDGGNSGSGIFGHVVRSSVSSHLCLFL